MKICFVCLYAYPLFKPSIGTAFGGSEVRAWLLATGLARNPSHHVSIVVFDHGQPGMERIGAVSVYPHSLHRPSPPGTSPWPAVWKYLVQVPRFPFVSIRHFEPAMLIELPVGLARGLLRRAGNALRRRFRPSLWLGPYEIVRARTRVYEQIDADVYCALGVGEFTAEVAAYCAAFRKKFVLLANSDENFSRDYFPGSSATNSDGSRGDACYRVVMAADSLVTQTDAQRELLRSRFGRDSVTIRNPVELAAPRPAGASGIRNDKIALWIGRADRVKQPEALLALARGLPDVRFVMVMNPSVPEIADQIARQLPANVQLLERLEYGEADRLIARAFVLINTSAFEGFPNTFLQAGKHGVPILSLNVDPDGFITGHGCGFVASGNVELLAQRLRALRDDRDTWNTCSANVRRYVEMNHGLDGRLRDLDALLARAVEAGAQSPGAGNP